MRGCLRDGNKQNSWRAGVGPRAAVVLLALGILLFQGGAARAITAAEEQREAARKAAWSNLYPRIKDADLQRHTLFMESRGSRVAGYPGNEQAALYIAAQFKRLGLKDASTPGLRPAGREYMEEFQVTTPIVHSASLQVRGKAGRVRIYPLWPNVVRTSKLPQGGLNLPLIYGGKGDLSEFNGKKVKGAAALMEFDSGGNWLNAPRLGASAVILIAPQQIGTGAERGEAESKFLKIPIDIPRFWIRREDAWPLLARLKSQKEVTVHLECDMAWEKRPSWNIIGEIPGRDPKLRSEVVYIESYYDSMSIVPELAPGAEAAGGVAAMLELARVLQQEPPARTVRFLATGAHFFSLGGIRSYLSQHIQALTEGTPHIVPAKFLGLIPYQKTVYEKQKINLLCALDLSSRSGRVGMFFKSMYYDLQPMWPGGIQARFSDLARVTRENADKVAGLFPEAAGGFADGVTPLAGKPWTSFIIGKVALDGEPVTLGGARGANFLTTDDARPLVDTPFDRADQINFANLGRQARLLSCLFWDAVTDPKAFVDKQPVFARVSVRDGFARVTGRAVRFEPKEGITPNKPVPGSLVILRTDNSTLTGVRSDLVELVNAKGEFAFDGVPPVTAYGARKPKTYLEAYHLNEETGAIDFAPDKGQEGGASYPTDFFVTTGITERTIVIFPCVSLVLYDLVDPQSLSTLRSLLVLDGESDAEPRSYGFAISKPETWLSHVEDVAIIFAKKGSRVKVIMTAGASAIRLLLLNEATMSDLHPMGLGYAAARSGMIDNTPLNVARDMWGLDERRIQRLAKFRIVNENVVQLHRQAAVYVKQSEEALKNLDYDSTNAFARAAWGYESKAYPAIQATNDDVIKGVIFYLALMLPFSFFLERLLVAAADLRRQIAGMVVIFAITCAIFSFIHPAFRISTNPWIIPLAFIMLALSILVIALVVMKFETQLRLFQQRLGGIHRADIGRLGVAGAAFSLGISNLRRRRARTFFTCITLVVLTFTVLSFTSVVSSTRFNIRPSPGIPPYQGILLRDAAWKPLEDSAYRVLEDEFGATRAVAPRSWFFSFDPQKSAGSEQSFITVSSNKAERKYLARALAGMSPAEARVTGFDKALEWGRWFQPGDKNVCIIPTAIAEAFNIGPRDIGRARIYLGGVPFDLIGVLNSARATSLVDLDQERITPADFIQMQSMLSRQGGAPQTEQAFQEYLHLSPDDIALIPYETALNLGGTLASVAVEFTHPKEVNDTLRKLMPRLGLNLYAGQGDRILRWSSMAGTSIGGLQDLVVPIIIAALIVLNTMLGSVYERVKEIHIFSSIGLAPNHIGTLFLAEAFVYAVLGAMFGYLAGQSLAMLISKYNLIPGLSLNYSSVSAVASTTVVIATVMLSTLYPARKAAEVATPAVERRWHLPEPVGDTWEIPLPFAVTGAQAAALNAFMAEWFKSYEEYSIGDFVTENVQTKEEASPHGTGYCVSMMTWLSPFDLGVSQRSELRTLATEMEDVYEIKVTLLRESGDISSWKRVNRRFLNTLRKQFLIWRTLSGRERDRYLGVSQPVTAQTV